MERTNISQSGVFPSGLPGLRDLFRDAETTAFPSNL